MQVISNSFVSVRPFFRHGFVQLSQTWQRICHCCWLSTLHNCWYSFFLKLQATTKKSLLSRLLTTPMFGSWRMSRSAPFTHIWFAKDALIQRLPGGPTNSILGTPSLQDHIQSTCLFTFICSSLFYTRLAFYCFRISSFFIIISIAKAF